MRCTLLIALAACGRLRFDAVPDGDGGLADDDGRVADARPDAAPVMAWTRYVATAGTSAVVKRVAFGPDHGVVITGESTGDLTIGGMTHPAIGPIDMFVAKFHADGARAWSVVHGGTNS